MSAITATLNLTISSFLPIDQGSVTYSMTLATDEPQIFTLLPPPPSYQLIIEKPVNDPRPVQLIFSLNDPAYVLVGIYFTNAQHSLGRREFPTISIDRSDPISTMRVADAAIPETYTYAILVQQAATGLIGLVDPVIINRPGPPS